MLKKMINNVTVDLEIIPIDPLLIKSGQATVGGVDMSFVRTHHFGQQEEPFLPGSSLKGMIRAYAEKICRSLRDDPVPVCLPYLRPGRETKGETRQASCGLQLGKNKELSSCDIYRVSCPTCRLFGSLSFAGRFSTSDAYLTDEFRAKGSPVFEIRDGVAIDRITGGTAGGAKYDLEVLTRGEFGATIEIRNFERWQIGLIGLVLRDMEQGLVRLGFGKSRGLGRFQAKIKSFRVVYYGCQPTYFSGIAPICTEKETQDYDFHPEELKQEWKLPEPVHSGIRYEYNLTESWKNSLEAAVFDLNQYITKVDWPDKLEAIV